MNFLLWDYLKLKVASLIEGISGLRQDTVLLDPLLELFIVFSRTLDNLDENSFTDIDASVYPVSEVRATDVNIIASIRRNENIISRIRQESDFSSKEVWDGEYVTRLEHFLLDDKGNYLNDTGVAIRNFYEQCVELRKLINDKLQDNPDYQYKVFFLNMYVKTITNTLIDLSSCR